MTNWAAKRDARHQHAAAVQLQLHGDRALRGAGDPHRQGHQLASGSELRWTSFRLSGRGAGLGDVTLLAMRMRATDILLVLWP